MKRPSRREFLQRMGRLGTVAPAAALFPGLPGIWSLEGSSTSSTRRKSGTAAAPTAGFTFTDIAAEAGLAGAVNVFGEATRKRYILEETGIPHCYEPGAALCSSRSGVCVAGNG